MAVALPTSPQAVDASPRFLFAGGEQRAPFGGATIQIEWLGSRFALDVSLPPMTAAVGRVWVSRLIRGLADGSVTLAWPQPDFTPGGNANAAVKTAVSGGTTLALKGLAASTQQLREGQFFSIIHGGQRYLHFVAQSDVTADGSGERTITIEPPLRTPVSVNDVVELGTPTIQGMLVGNERTWTIDLALTYGVEFSIEEAE